MSKVASIGGQTIIGGLNRIFHCNHYNAHLQMSVLMSQGIGTHDPARLLVDAAAPLINILKTDAGYSEKALLHEFSFCGFGKLNQVNETVWETPISHYGESIYVHGKPQHTCYFNAGYVQGITGQHTEQTASRQLGSSADQYTTAEESENLASYFKYDFELSDVPPRFEFPDCIPCKTQVDESAIIKAVSGLPLYGKINAKDDGLIHAFGVVLTNHFADYYNRISYETYYAMTKAGIPEEDVKEIFNPIRSCLRF